MIYLGIDNGISGGLALIGPCGHIIDKCPMPIQAKSGRGNEIDIAALRAWMRSHNLASEGVTVIIEEPGGSKSAAAAASMAASFGSIRGALAWAGIKTIRVTPQRWKKAMRCESADKGVALARAKEIWPDESWLASSRCRVAHTGEVDAALLAEYGRVNKL